MNMITDQLIRSRFINEVMSQGINKIYETQEKVVRTYLNTRSGNLVSHLQRRPFSAQEEDSKQVYYMRIFPYLRFLDIHYRRTSNDRISRHIRSNLAIYNRVVWGVLYHDIPRNQVWLYSRNPYPNSPRVKTSFSRRTFLNFISYG